MVAVESPNALEIELGQAQFEEGSQRSIVVVDPSRTGRPTVSPARVTWSTSDASVATVENGALHARGIGQARITASSGSTRSSVSVSVVRTPSELMIGQDGGVEGEVGRTLDWPLEAQVVNTHGRPIEGVEVRFKVKSGSGVVSPVIVSTDADGMARSEWTLGGTAGEQSVEVEALDTQVQSRTVVAAATPGPAHEILVTPAEVTLRPGSAFQFTASVVDVFGNVVGDTEVNWRSTDPEIAAIAGDGWVTGLQSGQASVEAEPVAGALGESQALIAELSASAMRGNGNAHVKVQTADGESDAVIAVMGGNHQTGRVGETLPLELEIQATDAAGRPLRQTDVNWLLDYGAGSLSAASGRTNGQGRASVSLSLGTMPGQVKVTADLGDLGSAAFFATAEVGSLVEIRVSPETASLEVGAGQDFEVAAFDEYGNPVTDHPAPTWSVSHQAIATVSSAGRAHGESAGSTGVRATIEGVTDDAQLQVTDASNGGDDGGDTGGTDGGDTGGTDDTGDTGGTDDGGDTGGTDDSGDTGGTDGGDGGTQTLTDPAKVTDLEVVGSTETTATVRFTQVDDGTGEPAQYQVRWHLHPIEWGWGQATTASGSCEDPITGDQIGAPLTCTVEGLNPDTKYDFQLVAFRVEDSGRVFSPLSSIATGTTASSNDGSDSGDEGASVATLEASRSSVSFTALEESVTLSAQALDESGQPVSGVSTEWQSSDQGVVSVDQLGTIVAKAIGTALVVVSTTCCDTAVTDTVTVSVDQVPAAITVDPASVSLEAGATQQLVASVNDSNDYPIEGASVTWISSDTGIVEVTSDGTLTAKASGSATVTARYSDYESSSSVHVQNENTTSAGGAEPFHSENFSGYGSATDYFDQIPHRGWTKNESNMDFIADGPAGVGGQAIRLSYYDATDIGGTGRDGRCGSTTVGFDYDIRPITNDVAQTEIWDEYWVKYSDNWSTVPPETWGCTGNPDHKLIFGHIFGTDRRFSFLTGNSGTDWVGSTPGVGDEIFRYRKPGSDAFYNGEWFRVRRHMKASSSEGVADGRYRVWVNDELIADSGAWEVPIDRIWGVGIGRNRNHHAGEHMYVSVAQFRIWNQDPGW